MELSEWRKYVEKETKKIKGQDSKEPGEATQQRSYPAPPPVKDESVKSTIITGPSKPRVRVAAPEPDEAAPAEQKPDSGKPEPKPEAAAKPVEPAAAPAAAKSAKDSDDGPVVRVGKKTTSTVHEVWAQAETTGRPEDDDSPGQTKQSAESLIANRQQQEQLFIQDFGAPKKGKTSADRIESAPEDKESARQELLNRLLDPTLTLEETALILNMCKATVRRYTNKGLLPHFRTPGNQRRFKLSDVLEFMKNYQNK